MPAAKLHRQMARAKQVILLAAAEATTHQVNANPRNYWKAGFYQLSVCRHDPIFALNNSLNSLAFADKS